MKTYHDIASDGGSDVVGQVAEHASRVAERLGQVRHVVAVMSGKGGVGKSTLTVNLAASLSRHGWVTGILDGDINGSSIARMTGVRGHIPQATAEGMTPARTKDIRVMAIDLFMPQDAAPVVWRAPTQHGAYTWRGMMEMAALREMLADTRWGELDVLLIDLPPGADKLPNVTDLIPTLSGTVVITDPSEVSQMVVARSITMAVDIVGAPVIGLVENMGPYTCQACGHAEALFPSGCVEKMAEDHRVSYLGCVPFDPRLSRAADSGTIFVEQYPESAAAVVINSLAARIRDFLE